MSYRVTRERDGVIIVEEIDDKTGKTVDGHLLDENWTRLGGRDLSIEDALKNLQKIGSEMVGFEED
jgi:hypothetical protein